MGDFRGPWPIKLPPITARDRINDIPDVKVSKAHATKFAVTYRGRYVGNVRRNLQTGLFGYELTRGDRNLSLYADFTHESKRQAVIAMIEHIDSIGGDIDSALNEKALRDKKIIAMWRAQQLGPNRTGGPRRGK